jgi:hypothetical protein
MADNGIFNQEENFASDLYTWNDPVYPPVTKDRTTLRSLLASSESDIHVSGTVRNAADGSLLAGARLFCYDKESERIATAETDSDGSYTFRLPEGRYTITVSKLKCIAVSKVLVVADDPMIRLDFNLQPVKTNAGYLQVLNGSLAEGNQGDITLENKFIAMAIAVGSSDEQLGAATKGKPIDLSTTDDVDGFDWLNLPLISIKKLSGISGSMGSQSKNVQFSSVKILESSPTGSKVEAVGKCIDLPLTVRNLYVVKPDKEWFDVTTTISNVSDTTVSFWLGDAMDNDEYGQTSVYPMKRFGSTVIVNTDGGLDEFKPAEPWMGCFGKSDQVFGIFYKGDFAKGFLISANTYRTVSQKYITIEPGATYTLSRQLAAVPVKSNQPHSVALRSCYESTYDEWGLTSMLLVNKTKMAAGDTLQCELSITNVSRYNVFEEVSGVLSLPPYWKGNVDTVFFGDLEPQQTVVAKWKVIPTEGSGNTILSAQALAWKEQFTYGERLVYVSGEGWYAGDNHVHSRYSDGWATIPDNVLTARANGLSFISCTDHNTTIQDSTAKANSSAEFLALTGCEVTPNYKQPNNWGHAVSLFSNKMIPFSNTPSQANAQEIVTNINALRNGHGYAIMGHPFEKGCPWVYTNVSGFKGVEVWTCFTPVHGLYSNQAFALWDKRNNSGIKQYGYADSDAHNLDMVGRPHIVAHLKSLSQDEIESAMFKGQFYGTNGPSLRFTVDTVMMGGSLPVNSKKAVKIAMKAYSIQGVDSMYLLKNGVLIKGFAYSDYVASVQQVVYDEAVPGDFYRMECTDRWCQFAFSNPVFIVPAEQVTPQIVDTLSTRLLVNEIKVGLSPNPATEWLDIRSEKPMNASIMVLDLNGKCWMRSTLEGNSEKRLDVRYLPRGLYFVKVDDKRLKLILK